MLVTPARNASKRYAESTQTALRPYSPLALRLARVLTVLPQCDGHNPCAACRRLNRTECTFTPHPTDEDPHYRSPQSEASSSKKRPDRSATTSTTTPSKQASAAPRNISASGVFPAQTGNQRTIKEEGVLDPGYRNEQASGYAIGQVGDSTVDEEAEVHQMERMLEDRQGQLQYIGDSANLSFVQLLRMVVETISGPSAFTLDPDRHRTLETRSLPPTDGNVFHLLPIREVADMLVDAFFTNTFGLMQFFDEQTFNDSVAQSYKEMFAMDRTWFAQFYMVLAIGCCLATPKPGSREAEAIGELRSAHPFKSDEYFNAAKRLNDPLHDLDNANFQSIKLLGLFSLYMLSRARRNTAYIYTGTAIRLSYSLGLHREETFVVFPKAEQDDRRRVWRSLFLLDCFLSVSLGRPLAVGEVESAAILSHTAPDDMHRKGKAAAHAHICEPSLNATLRSCHFMGQVIRKVYYHRKVSIKAAQVLAHECRQWPKGLPSYLHAREASPESPRAAIAIFHCNLLYCHSLILLTRPFFLNLLSNEVQHDWLKMDVKPSQRTGDIKNLSDACIAAAMRTVPLAHNAYQGGYLSRLNPFATYAVYTAALVICANEVTRSTGSQLALQAVLDAIVILKYCGEEDNQADRSALTLQAFLDVIQSLSHRNHYGAPFYERRSLPGRPRTTTQHNSYPTVSNPVFTSSLQPFSPTANFASTTATPRLGEPWTTSTFESPTADSSASDLLDFDNIAHPTLSEPLTSGPEDELNFDTLWNWPVASPQPQNDSFQETDTFRHLFPGTDQLP